MGGKGSKYRKENSKTISARKKQKGNSSTHVWHWNGERIGKTAAHDDTARPETTSGHQQTRDLASRTSLAQHKGGLTVKFSPSLLMDSLIRILANCDSLN
ncbi:hypothetical protein CHS0354_003338 [Potamilus streckersoni]|uniref:Uncharacterized protein n=1 Tax=Potamilus streckersoni TaxID=2493646 RepID=A0AAE0S5V8_9BIVA|nr:hypothetical protein CHS0354_003338 [Potamilus streckersoni]